MSEGYVRASARQVARDRIPEIVGKSPAIERVRELIDTSARSDFNVVIVGETGTGKELVARAIHRLSALGAGPFIAHNCALTPPDLFDSEFFGHLRGAFTGALRDRVGLLMQAHGGSLFLDELECLSAAHQAKLLRVLDDGQVRQLGSEVPRGVSVRFIAASNKSPQEMLAKGELRQDLFYRLSGFEIQLPPLRERAQDALLLAEHFLAGTDKTLTANGARALLRYTWPGNVRQLKNLLYRSASTLHGLEIDERDLGLELQTGSEPPPVAWSAAAAKAASANPPGLQAAERHAIVQALTAHAGNLSRAAAALGIHRTTLRRKIKLMGLEPRPDSLGFRR